MLNNIIIHNILTFTLDGILWEWTQTSGFFSSCSVLVPFFFSPTVDSPLLCVSVVVLGTVDEDWPCPSIYIKKKTLLAVLQAGALQS